MGKHSPTKQPDGTPTAKVTAGGLTAAFAALLVGVAWHFGVPLTPDAAAGIVAALGFAAAYLKKSRPGEHDR